MSSCRDRAFFRESLPPLKFHNTQATKFTVNFGTKEDQIQEPSLIVALGMFRIPHHVPYGPVLLFRAAVDTVLHEQRMGRRYHWH